MLYGIYDEMSCVNKEVCELLSREFREDVIVELTRYLCHEWESGRAKGILRKGIPSSSCKVKLWSGYHLHAECKSGGDDYYENLC